MCFLKSKHKSCSWIHNLLLIRLILCSFIQEEIQRSVTNSVRVESIVLATKSSSNNPKGKERPLCIHCGKFGHTVDKCYKLHGFPPGYKFKNRNMMAHQVSTVANQFQGHCLAPNTDHNPVANQF